MTAADNEDEVNEESILYEVIEYFVKKPEPETVKCRNDGVILSTRGTIKNALRYLNNSYSLPESISQHISSTLSWKIAIGDNGRIMAILQENIIEIRRIKDEYSSVTGKTSVPKDSFPQWRKLSWSPDGQILALASSNGQLSFYNSLGNNIFNLNSHKHVSSNPYILEAGDAVAAMIFKKAQVQKDISWDYEFISISHSGLLKSYHISAGSNNFDFHHEFSFVNYYRKGVNTVVYSEKYDLLFVAGNTISSSSSFSALGFGLSSWRFLNDRPYHKLSFASEEEMFDKPSYSIWNYIPVIRKKAQSVIFKLSISPNSQLLACIHTDGCISIWSLPNLRMQKLWNLIDQPEYNVENPSRAKKLKKFAPNPLEFHPLDIGWWSDQSIIITRYSGAVSVCSIKNMKNLLGSSPEFLFGQPQISEMNSRQGFLCLDCEITITSMKRNLESSSLEGKTLDTSTTDDDSDKDEYEIESNTILNYAARLIQNTLYSITDIERFQPKRRKSRIMHKVYKIIGLKSTTPGELYSRKIEIEDYEEALSLAKTYNLDTDLVYQTQWRKSKFSSDDIEKHLAKITKRSWVLNECVSRVPETLEAVRELLMFGLRGANLETLDEIAENDDGRFRASKSNNEEICIGGESLTLEKAQQINKYIKRLDYRNFSESQKELIRYRKKLLDLLDNLQTYEIIFGWKEKKEKKFYEKFRQHSPLENAIRFAKESDCRGVEILFTYYGSKLTPHWLAILSFFPETYNPINYEKLLPKCDQEGKLFLLYKRELRAMDWVERSEFSDLFYQSVDDDEIASSFIYEQNPSLRPYKNKELTLDLLKKWYKWRAREIERESGIIDHASQLLNIGKINNIPGLENYLFELETLDDLIYGVGLEFLSFSEVEKLSDFEKVKLLMSKSDEFTFLSDIKNRVLPFIKRRQEYLPESGPGNHLLRQYLIYTGKNNLNWLVTFFQYLSKTPDEETIKILKDPKTLAIECIYACTDCEMYESAKDIYEAVSTYPDTSANSEIMDEFKRELECLRILSEYGVKITLEQLNQKKDNTEEMKLILIEVSDRFKNRLPLPVEKEWTHLLNDMLEIQELIFTNLNVEVCFEICLLAKLRSGDKCAIQNCSCLMEMKKNEPSLLKVSHDKAVDFVLQASREYLDNAKNFKDINIDLARACLRLILDNNPQIKEEQDLIESLKILDEFNIDILPLQVRLMNDKMDLLTKCLEKRDNAYKNQKQLLNLAKCLNIDKNNYRLREARVLEMIARKALEMNDHDVCASTVGKMMDENYQPTWKIALNLGLSENFNDLIFKRRCLFFALDNAPNELLEDLLKHLNLLEMQILNKNIQDYLPPNNNDDDDDDDDENDFSNKDESDVELTTTASVEKSEYVSNILGTSTKLVVSSANLVKETTFGILKHAGNSDFWKTALLFRSFPESDNFISKEQVERVVDKNLQSFHCFYQSLHKNARSSKFDTNYSEYRLVQRENARFKLCQSLLRMSMLSETACYGSVLSDINHLFIESGQNILNEDSLLGLGFLLSVSDNCIREVATVFQNLPQNELNVQLALYYFSLKLFMRENPSDFNVLLYDPIELIQAMLRKKESKGNEELISLLQSQIHSLCPKLGIEAGSNSKNDIRPEAGEIEDDCRRPESPRNVEEAFSNTISIKSFQDISQKIPTENQSCTIIGPSEEISEVTHLNLSCKTEIGDGWDNWENDDWDDFSNDQKIDIEEKIINKSSSRKSDSTLNTNLSSRKVPTEREYTELLQKMLDLVENEEQYLEAKEYLKQCPDSTTLDNTEADKNLILELVRKVRTVFGEYSVNNNETRVMQEIKEILSCRNIPKDVLLSFLELEKNNLKLEEQIHIRLCCNEPSLHTEAVNIIKDNYQILKLTPPILEELFFNNLTASFGTTHALYYKILENVFLNRTLPEIQENVKELINQLINQKNIPHAIALLNQIEGVPLSLSTYDSCFQLLIKK